MSPVNLEIHDLEFWGNVFNYFLDDFLSSVFSVLALFELLLLYCILAFLDCFLNVLSPSYLFVIFSELFL